MTDYSMIRQRIGRRVRAVRRALSLKQIPCSEAVGDWLRRMGGCERVGSLPDGTAIAGGCKDGLERVRAAVPEHHQPLAHFPWPPLVVLSCPALALRLNPLLTPDPADCFSRQAFQQNDCR